MGKNRSLYESIICHQKCELYLRWVHPSEAEKVGNKKHTEEDEQAEGRLAEGVPRQQEEVDAQHPQEASEATEQDPAAAAEEAKCCSKCQAQKDCAEQEATPGARCTKVKDNTMNKLDYIVENMFLGF